MNGEPTDKLGVVRFAERQPTSWKNGRGSTRELAKRLLGGTGPEFVWRLSIAEVTQDAEFSTFPGVERTATLIWGQGMELEVDGVTTVLEPFSPFTFPGGAETFARPQGGPARLLNVMTTTSRMVADVEVVDLGAGRPLTVAGATTFAQLSGEGIATATDGSTAVLAPLDVLVPRQRVRLVHGTGLAAVVRMTNYRTYHAFA